jgi:hypothetical protein
MTLFRRPTVFAVICLLKISKGSHIIRDMSRVYDEIVDFIVAGTTSQGVAEYQASEETKSHVGDLIHKQKTIGLTKEETDELQTYVRLEHLMRLAKARARQRIAHE